MYYTVLYSRYIYKQAKRKVLGKINTNLNAIVYNTITTISYANSPRGRLLLAMSYNKKFGYRSYFLDITRSYSFPNQN